MAERRNVMAVRPGGVILCKWCRRPFPRRVGKVYCSQVCKQRDYRDRKKAQKITAESLLKTREEMRAKGYSTTFVDMQLDLLGRGY